jgi:Zn-dependent metalloprotease
MPEPRNSKELQDAVKSGKMKINKQEIFSPGKVGAAIVSKLAARTSAALVAKNVAKKVVPKVAKKLAEPKSAVKTISPQGKASQTVRNQKEAERITRNPMPKGSRVSARPDNKIAKIKISKNLTARVPAKSNYEFAKDMSRFEKIQKQNAGPLKATKAEAAANARGLKAANKPSLAKSVTKKSPSALSVKIGKKMYPSGVPLMSKGKK